MDDATDREAAEEKLGWFGTIAGIVTLGAVIVANVGVAARYIFLVSMPSIEEILRYLFIWIICVGTALSFGEGNLISITLLSDWLKQRKPYYKALLVFQNLCILFFSGLCVFKGWEMMAMQFEFGEMSVVIDMNMGWVTFGLIVGFLIMSFFTLRNLMRVFTAS